VDFCSQVLYLKFKIIEKNLFEHFLRQTAWQTRCASCLTSIFGVKVVFLTPIKLLNNAPVLPL
jgi:hypothetical protein